MSTGTFNIVHDKRINLPHLVVMVILLSEIDEKIALVEVQIVEVEAQIKQAGEDAHSYIDGDEKKFEYYRKKEEQLRKKEEQLRDEKKQLRDEKKQQQSGGRYFSVLYKLIPSFSILFLLSVSSMNMLLHCARSSRPFGLKLEELYSPDLFSSYIVILVLGTLERKNTELTYQIELAALEHKLALVNFHQTVGNLKDQIKRGVHTTTKLLENTTDTMAEYFDQAEIVDFWLDNKENTRWGAQKYWEQYRDRDPNVKELDHIQPLFEAKGILFQKFPKSSPWEFVDTHKTQSLGFTQDATLYLKGQAGSALAIGALFEFTGQQEAVKGYPSRDHKAKFVRDLLRVRSKAGNKREVHGCITDLSRLVAVKLVGIEDGLPILQKTAVVTGEYVRKFMTAFASAKPDAVGTTSLVFNVVVRENDMPLELSPGSCLGRGAHGAVYTIADHKENNSVQDCYVKVFADATSFDIELSALAALQTCSDPHIPLLVAQGSDCMVASPCGVVSKDFRGSTAMFKLCAGLCLGLDKVHASGLVHRDIRPSNIIIARPEIENIAILIDWAAAKRLDEKTNMFSGAYQGTVHYAAASVLRQIETGSRVIKVSPCTDLESLVYSAYVLTRPQMEPIPPLEIPSENIAGICTAWQEVMDSHPAWRQRIELARACDYDELAKTFLQI
jgi:hypothetical protein